MIIIDCDRPEGNVFSIMGVAKVVMKANGESKESIAMLLHSMKSSDYSNALEVVEKNLGEFITFINKPEK